MNHFESHLGKMDFKLRRQRERKKRKRWKWIRLLDSYGKTWPNGLAPLLRLLAYSMDFARPRGWLPPRDISAVSILSANPEGGRQKGSQKSQLPASMIRMLHLHLRFLSPRASLARVGSSFPAIPRLSLLSHLTGQKRAEQSRQKQWELTFNWLLLLLLLLLRLPSIENLR